MHTNKYGKREFISLFENKFAKTLPHLHIILLANPGETVSQLIRNYFKEYNPIIKKSPVYAKRCDDYIEKRVEYVVEQCVKFKTVVVGNMDNLEPYAKQVLGLIEREDSKIGDFKPVFPTLKNYGVENVTL